MQGVPHYLYGVLGGDVACNAGLWLKMVGEIDDPRQKIFCGGTGMYLNALFNGIVELPEIPAETRESVRAMDLAEVEAQIADEMPENMRGNQQRMRRALEVKLTTGKSLAEWHDSQEITSSQSDYIVLHKDIERSVLRERIARRLDVMVAQGAVDEVRAVLEKNYGDDMPIMKALGVPEFGAFIKNKISLEEATQKAVQNSQRYAKRQQTWFRNQIDGAVAIGEQSVDEILRQISENL